MTKQQARLYWRRKHLPIWVNITQIRQIESLCLTMTRRSWSLTVEQAVARLGPNRLSLVASEPEISNPCPVITMLINTLRQRVMEEWASLRLIWQCLASYFPPSPSHSQQMIAHRSTLPSRHRESARVLASQEPFLDANNSKQPLQPRQLNRRKRL